jgi:hypothetical protein
MKKILLVTFAVLANCLPVAAEMRVSDAVVTTAVVDRAPIDSIQIYPASVERLYFFTHVEGAPMETSVTHVWHLNEIEMARMALPVRSPSWRTWSSKSFQYELKGDWRVEVFDSEGNLLSRVSFTLF